MALIMWGRERIGASPETRKVTRFLMDTYVTIQVPDEAGVAGAIEKALDRMEQIDSTFNVLNPSSCLYRFNHQNVPISDPEILGLIRTSLEISRLSDGAFDITVYPLVDLWGFFRDAPAIPSRNDLDARMRQVGWQKLRIEDGTLTKIQPDVQIDLGGIAKGYAVGEALTSLKESGITSALIDAGGDIYAIGTLHDKPWKVGIRNPRGEGVIGILDVSDLTVVTSGDYERFFEEGGVRYHHILDPRTGYPASDIISVTIIGTDAARVDGLSTAVFVLGPRKGMELVENLPDIEALIITTDGETICSSGLMDGLKIVKSNATNAFSAVDK